MSSSQNLQLNVCDCNRIHLTYASVTLHFEKEEFLTYAMHVNRMASGVSSTNGFEEKRDHIGQKPIIALEQDSLNN